MLDDIWKSGVERKVFEKVNRFKDDLNKETKQLNVGMYRILESFKQNLEFKTELLKKTNPTLPLEKGYAILKNKGHIIGKNESISNFKIIEIHRQNEVVKAKIEQDKNTRMAELF